jgi:integrase/recombinase XerD
MALRHVENFLEMMTTERGAARNTIEAYRRDLIAFTDFMQQQHTTFETLAADHIRAYLSLHHTQGMEAASSARSLSALRQFFRFLLLEGVRTEDPCSLIDSPKTRRPLPRVLSEEDVLNLLKTAHGDQSPEGKRAAALLEILYATGLRVSELVSLPFSSIPQDQKPEQLCLIVRGKGDKERMVPLNAHAIKALMAYLPVRSTFIPSEKSGGIWLFPSASAQGHLTRQRFGQLLKELALQANLDPAKISPHIIRHAFATHLLHHGADLISVQKMLGHVDISTTQIYTHVLKEKLYELVHQHHPLSGEIQEEA